MTTTYFHLMAKPSSFHCNIQCEYCFYLSKEQTIPPEKSQFMNDDYDEAYRAVKKEMLEEIGCIGLLMRYNELPVRAVQSFLI